MKKIAILLLFVITFNSCKPSQQMATPQSETTETSFHPILLTSNPVLVNEAHTIDVSSFKLPHMEDILKARNTKANRIVDYAFAFDGVRYKRGGTTKDGMDCSGLVVTTFDSENISLPRVSRDIALTGNSIDLNQVSKGDLLFFATRKNSRTISHVGIVTTARDGFVEFIHASTSNGVIVSNLAEKYWYYAFIQARRVI